MQASARNVTLERVKTILWAVMGVWAVVTVARFGHGIGATSGLTDVAPWGFWIAFDVVGGVALAAGGFIVAALVYICGIQRLHHFARPAILTALLGYIAVAVGLLYDLGIPWHIWHPMIMPQHHSVLFEVAMCVMLYLTVLALEFSPAILEHPLFHRPLFQKVLRVIKSLTIPLVIAGIVLSTLHQSSLGSLFLIQPFRVHPLWYSPLLYVLFLVSACGLGLMMVTLEALLSAWLFGHKVDIGGLAILGRLASTVLGFYVLLRLGDLWARGIIPAHLDGSWQAGLFLFEITFSAVVPAVLLLFRRVRESIPGLATCSLLTVLGIIGHRFNVCIVAFDRPESMPYWPTWTEIAVSVGIVSGAALVFIFFNENLRIVDHGPGHAPTAEPIDSPETARQLDRPPFTPSFRRHSLAFVIAAGLAVGFLPEDAVFGPEPRPTPVQLARNVEALAVPAPDPLRQRFYMSSFAANVPAALDPEPVTVTVIDGNRDWRFVAFTHARHAEKLGGAESCRLCHHQNMTFDHNTACYQCHRDMYEPTDTFDHVLHIYKLGGNASCNVCHARNTMLKSRATALACWECHGDMVTHGSIIPEPEHGLIGIAPGYMDAMHGLCIRCHEYLSAAEPEKYGTEFGRCDVCHREFEERDHRRMAPYVPMPPGHVQQPDATTSYPAAQPAVAEPDSAVSVAPRQEEQ